MPANPTQERKDLEYVLGLDDPAALNVRVAITSEITVSADNDAGMPVTVLLQPRGSGGVARVYNLLDYAPIASWRQSTSLRQVVDRGWLFVDAEQTQTVNVVTPTSSCCGIEPPNNPQLGDLLMYDGTRWNRLSPGEEGSILRSQGTGQTLAWGGVSAELVTLAYAATVTLDLEEAEPTLLATLTLTGNVSFATANLAAPKSCSLRIVAGGSDRTLSFPNDWRFLGGEVPTEILAGEVAILSFTAYGTTNSDVVAAYAVTVTEESSPSS